MRVRSGRRRSARAAHPSQVGLRDAMSLTVPAVSDGCDGKCNKASDNRNSVRLRAMRICDAPRPGVDLHTCTELPTHTDPHELNNVLHIWLPCTPLGGDHPGGWGQGARRVCTRDRSTAWMHPCIGLFSGPRCSRKSTKKMFMRLID